jgi:hypothetical protein
MHPLAAVWAAGIERAADDELKRWVLKAAQWSDWAIALKAVVGKLTTEELGAAHKAENDALAQLNRDAVKFRTDQNQALYSLLGVALKAAAAAV